MLYKYIYTLRQKEEKYISIYIYIYIYMVIFFVAHMGSREGGEIKDAISLLVFFETRRKRGRERKKSSAQSVLLIFL